MKSQVGWRHYTYIFIFTVLTFLLINTQSVSAAYIENLPMKMMQPDGSSMKCWASGDEAFNWLHDENDNIIIQDSGTGFYVYAGLKEEKLVSTQDVPGKTSGIYQGVKVKELNPDIIAALQRPRTPPSGMSSLSTRRNAAIEQLPPLMPHTGTVNNLVIFIRFSDDSEFSTPLSNYNIMFNSTSPDAVSVANYFEEVSYKKLGVSTSFYPHSTGDTIVSYQDSYPRCYYEPWSSINPNGYDNYYELDRRELSLLQNAVQYVNGQMPADLNIDSDNDGYVDNLCFIVKDSEEVTTEWGNLLWAHQYYMTTSDVYIGSKKVSTYNFYMETFINPGKVGVICHEMMHSIGAPDLYHYSYDGIDPVYKWDIMANTTDPPQQLGAYMKKRYGNWIDSIPEITSPGTYILNPLSLASSNNSYKVKSLYSDTEYLVLEYRARNSIFENSLPGSGLLVYRINQQQDGKGNQEGPPDEVYLYRPGGTSTKNGLPEMAYFSNNSGLDDNTNPALSLSDGSRSGVIISNIGSAAETISFNLEFKPQAPIFSLEPGTYNTAQDLTIRNLEAQGEIRYTLDSSEPTANSPLYLEPLRLTSPDSVTVRARVFKTGVGESDTSSAIYTIMPAGAYPESVHPYENGVKQMWCFTAPGTPDSINVTFDPQTSLQTSWDYIQITDAAGTPIPGSPFTGTALAGKTVNVNGSTVIIRLLSDEITNDWGFRVTDINSSDECFIATAAFGSKFQPAVVLLRQFRDRFLLTNAPGRAVVAFYYKKSPPVADFIAGSSLLRGMVRAILIPFITVAYLSFHPLIMLGLLIGGLIMSIFIKRKLFLV